MCLDRLEHIRHEIIKIELYLRDLERAAASPVMTNAIRASLSRIEADLRKCDRKIVKEVFGDV